MKKLIMMIMLLACCLAGHAQDRSNNDVASLPKAIQLSIKGGANRYASKEVAIEGQWKQRLNPNLYFNGGLSLGFDCTASWSYGQDQQRLRTPSATVFEVGIPLQIELGRLNRSCGSFYGLFGLTPTVYATMGSKSFNLATNKMENGDKPSGFMLSPSLEVGRNFTAGGNIFRFGIYASYKINCTPGDFDIYQKVAGRMFFGAKIGLVL